MKLFINNYDSSDEYYEYNLHLGITTNYNQRLCSAAQGDYIFRFCSFGSIAKKMLSPSIKPYAKGPPQPAKAHIEIRNVTMFLKPLHALNLRFEVLKLLLILANS